MTNEDINVIFSGKFNIKRFHSRNGDSSNGEMTYIGKANKFHLFGTDLELEPEDIVELKNGQILVNGEPPKNKKINFWLKLYNKIKGI